MAFIRQFLNVQQKKTEKSEKDDEKNSSELTKI